jgi:hypothetical protein
LIFFIIYAPVRRRKCAILIFVDSLQIKDGVRNFAQAHLGNVAGRNAEGVDGVARVEVHNALKILRLKVFVRVQTAACE